MAQIITPGEAALLVWAVGTVYLTLRLFRTMNRVVERDCPCTRSGLHYTSVMMSALPGKLGVTLLAAALVLAGMCWPVLIPYREIHRRFGTRQRCERCGRLLLPPAPSR